MTDKRGGVSAMSAGIAIDQVVFEPPDKQIESHEAIKILGQMRKHHAPRHLVVTLDHAPLRASKGNLSQASIRCVDAPVEMSYAR